MQALLPALVGIGLFAAVLALCLRLFARMPDDPALRALIAGKPRPFLDTGPAQACWTEEIGRDGVYAFARAQCPNDALMELDARARRGDFPIPIRDE